MKYKPVPWVTQDINKCPWPWKDKPHTWPVPPSILEFGVPPGHLGFNSSVPQWHSGSVIGRPRSRRPAPEAPEASAKVFPTLRPVSLRAELHRSPTAQVQLSLLSLHTVFATRYICAFSSFQEIDSESSSGSDRQTGPISCSQWLNKMRQKTSPPEPSGQVILSSPLQWAILNRASF